METPIFEESWSYDCALFRMGSVILITRNLHDELTPWQVVLPWQDSWAGNPRLFDVLVSPTSSGLRECCEVSLAAPLNLGRVCACPLLRYIERLDPSGIGSSGRLGGLVTALCSIPSMRNPNWLIFFHWVNIRNVLKAIQMLWEAPVLHIFMVSS